MVNSWSIRGNSSLIAFFHRCSGEQARSVFKSLSDFAFQNFFGGCFRSQARSKIFLEAVHTGGGRPLSKGLDFVRPFSRSADLERARLCPRLIKWLDMLFILSGFLFYGVREKRRAEPSAVAFGAVLLVLFRAHRYWSYALKCTIRTIPYVSV